MAHGLLDLRLEVGVLRQQAVVGLGAELRMLVHVFDLLLRSITCAHEARRTSAELGELVEVVAHILALVQHVHQLLHLAELRTHLRLVEVRLHDGCELVQLRLPKRNVVDQVQVVRPIGAEDLRAEVVQLLKHVLALVLDHRHVRPRRCCHCKSGLAEDRRGCEAGGRRRCNCKARSRCAEVHHAPASDNHRHCSRKMRNQHKLWAFCAET
mmetsp:Transcript_90859/g.256098  ORF Transcript_90859/g.256098 Transcript_90859/m.256098 type:complete len:211 (-) Transcript_90859:18-650(-)